MEQQIAKIEAHTEKLLNLLLGVHTVLAILRPMNIDEKLVARFSRKNKGAGFGTIRHVLYWNVVQELVKIVADDDRRVPSIHNLRGHLEDERVKAAFRKKYSSWGLPAKGSKATTMKESWRGMALLREQESKQMFDLLYEKAMKESAELLNSSALANMKEVRDKLLAHNELKYQNGSYRFIDIQRYGLKYGDERVILEMATRVFDDFFALVKRASFEWDRSKAMMERDAKSFWRD
jgi:hypothetical protein